MENHTFNTEEYLRLAALWRREGFAEGMNPCRKEMGEALDKVIESMHGTIPYRFPNWKRGCVISMDLSPTIEFSRPSFTELTRDHLEAIRFWLCGPPPERKKF